MPIQNKGKSAEHIATICKNYINHTGDLDDFLRQIPSLTNQSHVEAN